MKNPELYEKTVNLLLDSYTAGKLFHGRCDACALGNILNTGDWAFDFCTFPDTLGLSQKSFKRDEEDTLYFNRLYKGSGYSREELMKIEYAFESSIAKDYHLYREVKTKEGQYLGLCAVLDVLKEIHETETQESEVSKDKLKKIAKDKYLVTV